MVKDLITNFITKLKTPVDSLKEYANSDDMKKALIRLLVVAILISIVAHISAIALINKALDNSWYNDLSKSELAEVKDEMMENAELGDLFLKNTLTNVISISILTATLFFIAKFAKSSKTFVFCLSMSANAVGVVALASVLNLVISLIYVPLGLLVIFATSLYAAYSLIFAFKESLDIDDTNKLVFIITSVISIVIVIAVIALSMYLDESLSDITSLTSLL